MIKPDPLKKIPTLDFRTRISSISSGMEVLEEGEAEMLI